jgi:YD repeat-containing protein
MRIKRLIHHSLPILFSIFLPLVFSAISQGNSEQYFYDNLGRLSKSIDDNGNYASYEYDAVGNLISITTTSTAAAVAILDMEPWTGQVGAIVTVYGKGFSGTTTNNSIQFNGIPATVVSSTTSVIVTSVPFGATSGPVTVQTPNGIATGSKNFSVTQLSTILLSPSSAFLMPGQSMQFAAIITGVTNTAVLWSVNGIDGGTAAIGTIVNGLYSAPANVNQLSMVTIGARIIADPTKFAEIPVYFGVERIVSHSVSVAIQLPPQAVAVGPIVAPSVAVVVQPQPSVMSEGPIVAPSISLNVGPYVSSVIPLAAAYGSNLTLSISGIGFSGVTAIDFYHDGVVDTEFAVSNIQINPVGTQVSADVIISPTATAGIRLVKITASSGSSQGYFAEGNIFTVTAP